MSRSHYIALARKFGVKNPELLDTSALAFTVGTYQDMEKIRYEAEKVGISLPEDIKHLGTLRARFEAEVKKRLQHIKKDSEILYKGECYVVARIVGMRYYILQFTLRPKMGGRTIIVQATTLMLGMRQD